jgi:hypothetical protein
MTGLSEGSRSPLTSPIDRARGESYNSLTFEQLPTPQAIDEDNGATRSLL